MHEGFGSSTAKLSSLVTQEEIMVRVKLLRSPVIQCVAMEKSDHLSQKITKQSRRWLTGTAQDACVSAIFPELTVNLISLRFFFYQLESRSFCPSFLCWNLSFSRLTGSAVCKPCRRWGRHSLEGSSDEVLASNTCLFHLGLPSRFWTMMSSYSSHGFLFPQSSWTGSKIFVRLNMGWMNHNTHFSFCSTQAVSQMTARLLKVRPEIITVKNCAGDWTYSCRFECRTIHAGIRGKASHLHPWVLVPSPMSLSSHCSLNRRYRSTNGVLVWKGFTLMPCSLSNTNTSVFQE